MNSKIEVFSGYGHDGNIIFKAGTTCYRSEHKTKKTPEDFIKIFKKMKHLSMLEFMWVTIVIRDFNYVLENYIFSREKFLTCSRMADHNTVVSGNGRAWLEFMDRYRGYFKDFEKMKKKNHIYWLAYNTIAEVLNAVNSTMFDFEFEKLEKPMEVSYVESIDKDDKELYDKHNWVAIKFENISRGLIDEFVRHRRMSYAVSSTRYIDNSNFNIIIDNLGQDEKKILMETVEKIKNGYEQLLKIGVKKDTARQLLPLGIAQEMVVAGTIENWNHIFNLRCQSNTHWEIRNLMEKVKSLEVF